MSTTFKNKKKNDFLLLNELDELIMEGWASDMPIGEILDSAPASLRNVFENLQLASTPVNNGDGTYTLTLRV